jgi:quinol monooxygenase YgiN
MSITVVLRRVAKPGREAELVRTMVGSLQQAYASRRQASIFQSDHDPAVALYVADWESPAAYEARRQRADPAIEDLCLEAECRYYQSIHLFERVLVPGPLLTCTEFAVPAAESVAVMRYLLQTSRPTIHQLPGCVLSVLYRDLAVPERLFALHRWHSEADRATYYTVSPPLGQPLRDRGVRIERFRGYARADVEAALPRTRSHEAAAP